MSKAENGSRSEAWRASYPQFIPLVDTWLSPYSRGRGCFSISEQLAISFVRQTGERLSEIGRFALAEDAREIVMDVINKSLSNKPNVREVLASREALSRNLETVITMLDPFPDDSSKMAILATAQIVQSYLELQKNGIFDPNNRRAIARLRPGLDSLAKAVVLCEKEGKPALRLILPPLRLSLKPAFV